MGEDTPAGPPGLSAAEAALADLQGQALVGEAEAHLAGRQWVTVWHGDLETEGDMRLVGALAEEAEAYQRQWPGCVVMRQGGNDYSATLFGPVEGAPSPAELADRWAEFAWRIAPAHPALAGKTWWHIVHAAPSAGPPSR